MEYDSRPRTGVNAFSKEDFSEKTNPDFTSTKKPEVKSWSLFILDF
jgi:hypothetical protein